MAADWIIRSQAGEGVNPSDSIVKRPWLAPAEFFQDRSAGVISEPDVDSHARRLRHITWRHNLEYDWVEGDKPCLGASAMIAPIS